MDLVFSTAISSQAQFSLNHNTWDGHEQLYIKYSNQQAVLTGLTESVGVGIVQSAGSSVLKSVEMGPLVPPTGNSWTTGRVTGPDMIFLSTAWF